MKLILHGRKISIVIKLFDCIKTPVSFEITSLREDVDSLKALNQSYIIISSIDNLLPSSGLLQKIKIFNNILSTSTSPNSLRFILIVIQDLTHKAISQEANGIIDSANSKYPNSIQLIYCKGIDLKQIFAIFGVSHITVTNTLRGSPYWQIQLFIAIKSYLTDANLSYTCSPLHKYSNLALPTYIDIRVVSDSTSLLLNRIARIKEDRWNALEKEEISCNKINNYEDILNTIPKHQANYILRRKRMLAKRNGIYILIDLNSKPITELQFSPQQPMLLVINADVILNFCQQNANYGYNLINDLVQISSHDAIYLWIRKAGENKLIEKYLQPINKVIATDYTCSNLFIKNGQTSQWTTNTKSGDWIHAAEATITANSKSIQGLIVTSSTAKLICSYDANVKTNFKESYNLYTKLCELFLAEKYLSITHYKDMIVIESLLGVEFVLSNIAHLIKPKITVCIGEVQMDSALFKGINMYNKSSSNITITTNLNDTEANYCISTFHKFTEILDKFKQC